MSKRPGIGNIGQPGCPYPAEVQVVVAGFKFGYWATTTIAKKTKTFYRDFISEFHGDEFDASYQGSVEKVNKKEQVDSAVVSKAESQESNLTKTATIESQSETLNTKVSSSENLVQLNETEATLVIQSKIENPVLDTQTNLEVENSNSHIAESTLIPSFERSYDIQNENINPNVLEQSLDVTEAQLDDGVENEAETAQIEIIPRQEPKTTYKPHFTRVLALDDKFDRLTLSRKNQATSAHILVNPSLDTEALPESVVGVDNWIVSSAIMVTLCHQNHFVVLHVVKSCHQGSRILGTFTGGLCSAALSTSKRRPKSRYHSHHAPILPTRFTLLFYPTGEKNYFVESKKPTFFSSFLPSYVF